MLFQLHRVSKAQVVMIYAALGTWASGETDVLNTGLRILLRSSVTSTTARVPSLDGLPKRRPMAYNGMAVTRQPIERFGCPRLLNNSSHPSVPPPSLSPRTRLRGRAPGPPHSTRPSTRVVWDMRSTSQLDRPIDVCRPQRFTSAQWIASPISKPLCAVTQWRPWSQSAIDGVGAEK